MYTVDTRHTQRNGNMNVCKVNVVQVKIYRATGGMKKRKKQMLCACDGCAYDGIRRRDKSERAKCTFFKSGRPASSCACVCVCDMREDVV